MALPDAKHWPSTSKVALSSLFSMPGEFEAEVRKRRPPASPSWS